ncbi:hypothetical protein KI387_035202 [Taxus chinensis]|uniref:U-box domain-containing protein n=1 Tax=Taxus chinensis TaxID=29808 RepID=A0AA38FNB0_TAXCH|nr:hypothetical protein KI387_035202 [Taxus chinensis]
MDVTDEVGEQVELLHKQSRRAGLFVDPAEELLRNDVLSVLDEFERKYFAGSRQCFRPASIGAFHIPPASLSIFSTLCVILWIPIYDSIIVPIARKYTKQERGFTKLQRIGIGLLISVAAMLAAALVELKHLGTIKTHNLVHENVATVPMSIIWQIPQYCLIGAAEVLTVIGKLEVAMVSMINSLIGLVRSCKCVLFGVAEECYDKDEQQAVGFTEASSTENIQVPDDFKCPISLDLMRDPEIVATGQTYDRVSITRWIEEGHCTCPKSGQKLLHTNLIPNHALRSLICQWCEKNGVPFEKSEKHARNGTLESIATTKAALEATKMTAAFLVENMSTGTAEMKKRVANELRLLAKCGMEKRACIAEAGAIPLLLSLLSSNDPKS